MTEATYATGRSRSRQRFRHKCGWDRDTRVDMDAIVVADISNSLGDQQIEV